MWLQSMGNQRALFAFSRLQTRLNHITTQVVKEAPINQLLLTALLNKDHSNKKEKLILGIAFQESRTQEELCQFYEKC